MKSKKVNLSVNIKTNRNISLKKLLKIWKSITKNMKVDLDLVFIYKMPLKEFSFKGILYMEAYYYLRVSSCFNQAYL